MTPSDLPRVLIIDDEAPIHRFLGPALQSAGYAPLRAETANQGLRVAGSQSPTVILLDLGLPDLDGQAVIPRLRAISQAPIIVLSARGREEEKVKALDGGAEDYVEKPFALGELLARLRVVLRRAAVSAASQSSRIRLGPLEIDLEHRMARLDGQAEPLRLSPREWDLLVVFARAAGRVLTHRQLLAAVWGVAHTEDAQYLRVYVGHLRQKLGPAARLLQTEPGVGYRFGGID
jgi:two-component system, OmpR family, KDP operon response regulator KdpE